jgi:triosephosphate isomerase
MSSSKRTPILAANWKMYKTAAEATGFFRSFLPAIQGLSGREVVVAPPFTAIAAASEAIAGSTEHVSLAAQDMHFENEGAYTGEISSLMLKEFGVRWVIVGHSERRHIIGEGDDLIALKLAAAMDAELIPILCIGETLEEREANRTLEVLERQLATGLSKVGSAAAGRLVLAYEPVWAIGTGKTATVGQAQDAHAHIRSWLAGRFNSSIAGEIRILYGGSAKPGNVDELLAAQDVDGALVGGASLDPESFAQIASCRVDS